MGYGGWAPYVPVAERRKKAEKAAAKAKKAGKELSPIAPYRGAIAKTFWGKAWCDNLERYSDYANRLPRGRTYVRNGSVIDLRITAGEVRAQVMGSSLYTVEVTVAEVPDRHWQAIGADCSRSIDSLVELLQGKLSKAVMERICIPELGLFPAPKDIELSCSCPDSASMCKHVAAVLYGVGARLDQQPELLFSLRQVDAKELVAQAGAGLPKAKKSPAAARILDDSGLADVFGIEMGELAPPAPPATTRKKSAATKVVMSEAKGAPATTTKRSAADESAAAAKATAKKPANAKAPTKAGSGSRGTTANTKAKAGKANAGATTKAAKPKAVAR